MPQLFFFTEDRRVVGRPGDRVGGVLASGNVAAADPATGVASVASEEMAATIAALFSLADVPCGKR